MPFIGSIAEPLRTPLLDSAGRHVEMDISEEGFKYRPFIMTERFEPSLSVPILPSDEDFLREAGVKAMSIIDMPDEPATIAYYFFGYCEDGVPAYRP